jgi:HlyD family secretion protein
MSRAKRGRRIAAIAAIVVIAIAAVLALTRSKKAKYKTTPVATGDISVSVSATGQLNPVNEVTVGSQVSGILAKVDVDYNDHVTAGQTLATIDPRNYDAALAQAKANLASAQASLTQAELSSSQAETLYASKLMAYSDYLQAKTNYELAKAKRDQAQASYEQAQLNLTYTTITAPMSGIVISRKVEPGQTVAASFQTPDLFVIADLSEMQVEVSIDEADVGKLDTGLTATFNVDAFPEETFEGKLVQVRNEPITDQNVVTYIGIVRVKNPDLMLKPGMTANVKVNVRGVQNVLLVPNGALSPKLVTLFGAGQRSGTPARQARESAGSGRGTAQSAGGQPGQAGTGVGQSAAAGGRRGQGRRQRTGAGPATSDTSRTATAPVTRRVFVFEKGKVVGREVMVGMSDSYNTEIKSGLSEGEPVITGLDQNKTGTSTQQGRPPMMGFGPGR